MAWLLSPPQFPIVRKWDGLSRPTDRIFTDLPPDCPGWSGVARYLAAWLGSYVATKVVIFVLSREQQDSIFRRGRKLVTQAEAQWLANRHAVSGQTTFPLGGVQMPDEAAACHLLVAGATGSGKTHLLSGIMRHALVPIGSGVDHRAILHDPKRDLIPKLHGLGVRGRIYILNPFDSRSVAWAIGRDCTSPATVQQCASDLIPEEDGPNKFFRDASCEILAGEMTSLMKSGPADWTLRDLILIFRDQRLLRQVLERDPETRSLCQYFEEERTYQNIRSSIASKINRFAPIAACWDRANESLALSDWIHSESILVLGHDPSIRFAMETVNRALYQRLGELLLSQPESATRRVWHFWDELKHAGRLEILPNIATFGRGAGNRLVLGFQDIDGLRHVYGREVANELTGQCATKAILRLDSPETAAWAAKIIADVEVLERRRSGMNNGQPSGGTTAEQVAKREAVLAGELLDLPPTNRQNGLTGYYVSPFTGDFRSTISAAEVDQLGIPSDPNVAGFIPRPADHQLLRPFDADDFRRLKLTPPDDGGRKFVPNIFTPRR